MPSISLKSWQVEIIENYKTAENLLIIFNPDKQVEYTSGANLKLCFSTEKAPSLNRLSATFGAKIAESWLEIQIYDLAEFSGVREKLDTKQLENLAKVIISNFGYLKLTELMVFFQKFKSGEYGVFYGVVDSLVITNALREFLKFRMYKLNEIQQEQESKRRDEMFDGAELRRMLTIRRFEKKAKREKRKKFYTSKRKFVRK